MNDTVQFGSARERRWPRGPRWLSFLVPVAAAATVAGVLISAGGSHPRRPSAVTITEAGHPLLGIRAGWELIGRGPQAMVRIQLARGRVIRTIVPALQSTGPVSFVAGPAQAIIRPLDAVPGYLVPDDGGPRRLGGALTGGGVLAPGPRPGQVWVQRGARPTGPVELAGPGGTRLGRPLAIPAGAPWLMAADGRGYLLISNDHGVYDARPAGLRQVTSGTVAAVGPASWLTTQCQRLGHCSMDIVNSATGARRVLSRSRVEPDYLPGGVISPGGSFAAVFRVNGTGGVTLRLIDLASGADHTLAVSNDLGFPDAGIAAWSPDGRWLFVAARGKLLAVDARTRQVRDLGVSLPTMAQVAVVSAAGLRGSGKAS